MALESPSTSVEGRRAIVTGAGNGLGLAIARRLACGGAKVLLVDKDPVVRERVQEEGFPKASARAAVIDLAGEDVAAPIFEAAVDAFGQVDTLVNNAAWSLHKPMLEMAPSEFNRLVAINQRAPYFLAQEFLRRIAQSPEKSRDPAIVNIASVNALAGNPNLVAYAGTKGALVAMTRAMAVEMAAYSVRVNTISPGAINTPATRAVFEKGMLNAEKFFDSYLVRRLSEPEEIAELVCYLCSPAAKYVTGANWVIDGGYCAR